MTMTAAQIAARCDSIRERQGWRVGGEDTLCDSTSLQTVRVLLAGLQHQRIRIRELVCDDWPSDKIFLTWPGVQLTVDGHDIVATTDDAQQTRVFAADQIVDIVNYLCAENRWCRMDYRSERERRATS